MKYGSILSALKEEFGDESITKTDFVSMMQYILAIAMDNICKEQNDKALLKMIAYPEAIDKNRELKKRIESIHKSLQRKIGEFYEASQARCTDSEAQYYDKLSTYLNLAKTNLAGRHNKASPLTLLYGYISWAKTFKYSEVTVDKDNKYCTVSGKKISKGESAYLLKTFCLMPSPSKTFTGRVDYFLIKKHPEREDLFIQLVKSLWDYRNIGKWFRNYIQEWQKDEFVNINSKETKYKNEHMLIQLNNFVDDKNVIKEMLRFYVKLSQFSKLCCNPEH
jgi:hypothetical protein